MGKVLEVDDFPKIAGRYTERDSTGNTTEKRTIEDGKGTTTIVEYPDGGKKVINPDGSGYYQTPDGKIIEFGPGEGGGCL